MQKLTLTKPDDWHLHLRDNNFLTLLLPQISLRFKRAIIMPNLEKPVTEIEQAIDYRQRILKALPKGAEFEPLMTLYLTEETPVLTVQKVSEINFIHAFKLYPKGVTTHSQQGVSSFKKLYPIFESMSKHQVPLLLHGEMPEPDIDVFDREKVFIDKILLPLIQTFPNLKIVLEHITTQDAVEVINENKGLLAGTITAHHLHLNRNDLLSPPLKPHHYCLPIVKRSHHQRALINAATSGSPKFFLGTDSAPHPRHLKECSAVCAGIYTSFAAIELYAEIFDQENKLDRLEAFASLYGPSFYGLPINSEQITLTKKPQFVPSQLGSTDLPLIPFRANSTIQWSLEALK